MLQPDDSVDAGQAFDVLSWSNSHAAIDNRDAEKYPQFLWIIVWIRTANLPMAQGSFFDQSGVIDFVQFQYLKGVADGVLC